MHKKYGINAVRGGDLKSVEDYVARFGRFWDKDIWNAILMIIALMLILLWFALDKLT